MRKIKRRTKPRKTKRSYQFEDVKFYQFNEDIKLTILHHVFRFDTKLFRYFDYLFNTSVINDNDEFAIDHELTDKFFSTTYTKESEILNKGLSNRTSRLRYDKKLKELGLISTKVRGRPPLKWYKININFLPKNAIINVPDSITSAITSAIEEIRSYKFAHQRAKRESALLVSYKYILLLYKYNNKIISKRFFHSKKLKLSDNNSNPKAEELREKLRNGNYHNRKTKSGSNSTSSNNPTRIIKRKVFDEVIDYWCSKGKPFAGVRNREVLYPLVKKAKHPKRPWEELFRIIDTGHNWFNDNDWLFRNNGSNIPMKSFFDKPYKNSYLYKFFEEHSIPNWIDLFRHKDKAWIEYNCTRKIKVARPDIFDLFRKYHPNARHNEIAIASSYIEKFFKLNNIEVNGHFQGTHTDDLENFIVDHPEKEIFWYMSKNTINYNFLNYVKNIGRWRDSHQFKNI